tara:strand:- start:4632 stop:5072 length:441 start_codon:yes stop_codon:yes gene_type:complete
MNERSEAAQNLFDEIRKINNRLRWLGDNLHLDLGVTAAKRSLLLTLDREGPHTVPDLARERLVSRQVVQTQVNDLIREGLIEHQPNPKHRRSTLLALSSKGRNLIQKMIERERSLVESAEDSPTAEELDFLRHELHELRTRLEAFG